MIPQYLREKEIPVAYKILTIAVVALSALPELIIPLVVLLFFPLFYSQKNKDAKRIVWGRFYKAYIVYAAFITVSFIWADSFYPSIVKGAMWFSLLLVVFYVALLADTKNKIENIVLSMVMAAAINGAVSILQMSFMATGNAKYFPTSFYRPLDEKLLSFFNISYPFENIQDRVTGFFDSPLVLATFFVIVFPLAAFCCFYATTKKRRVFSIVACGFIFFGLLFTFLRGAVVALILSFMILSFAGKRPAKFMSGSAIISAFVMLVVIFSRRGVSSSQDISTSYRLHIWAACFNSIKAKPLLGLGCGSNNVSVFLKDYSLEFPHANNLFFEVLTEGGVIGLLIFAAVITLLILNIYYVYKCGGWWRCFAIALLSSLVGFFSMSMFDYTLYTPKELLYFLLIAGLTEASCLVAPKHKEKYNIEIQNKS